MNRMYYKLSVLASSKRRVEKRKYFTNAMTDERGLDRQRDRQICKQTDLQKNPDRPINRQTYLHQTDIHRQTYIQTERLTDSKTDRHTSGNKEYF